MCARFATIDLLKEARVVADLVPEEEIFAASKGLRRETQSGRVYLGSSNTQGQRIYYDDIDFMILETCRVAHQGKTQMRHECEHATLSSVFMNGFYQFTKIVEAMKELIAHELRSINAVKP